MWRREKKNDRRPAIDQTPKWYQLQTSLREPPLALATLHSCVD